MEEEVWILVKNNYIMEEVDKIEENLCSKDRRGCRIDEGRYKCL